MVSIEFGGLGVALFTNQREDRSGVTLSVYTCVAYGQDWYRQSCTLCLRSGAVQEAAVGEGEALEVGVVRGGPEAGDLL